MDNICSYYLYISISDLHKSSSSKFIIMLDLYFTISNTTVVSSRVVMVVIVLYMDLQLPVQSVPNTTQVVSSNPFQARCTRHNIMW